MSKTVKEVVSDMPSVLFLDSSGQQMKFFIRPGPTKEQIAPLVTKGGGKMCRIQEHSAILLADPKDASSAMTSTGQTYISIQYIRDCLEQNQLLDRDRYVINGGPSKQTRSSTQNQGNGRLSYSAEDDAAILKFIEKRQSEAKGILVWREMQDKKLTKHTWQSMKDRFKRHIQFKLKEQSSEKCCSVASKRKSLDSSVNRENIFQTSSKDESSQKSPQKSVVDSDSTQVVAENSLCPADVSNPQPSPPDVPEAAEEPQQGSSDAGQQESCRQVQEQEVTNEEQQSQTQPSPEKSKRPRLDDDCDEQGPEESNGHSSSLTDTRKTPCETSSPAAKTLGILARAAREFEDSDGIGDESEEEEGPREASSKKLSDTHESSTAPAPAQEPEPENQAENDSDARQGPSEAICNGSPQIPDDERPGPSGTAVSSKIHVFILNSEIQEKDNSQPTPAETLMSSLEDIKQHVTNLMRETKTDLVEVTKALLKANGDLAKAQVYLLEGYEYEIHGPLWTPLDDEILLLADPYELVHLQSKYGEEDVTRRRAFLKADVH